MTKITIQKSNGIWKGFKSTGHAGYANHGEDIVCAAISVLLINTINSIEKFSRETKFQMDTKDGMIHFSLQNIPSQNTTLLLDSMLLGLEQIQEEYTTKYVKLIFEEV